MRLNRLRQYKWDACKALVQKYLKVQEDNPSCVLVAYGEPTCNNYLIIKDTPQEKFIMLYSSCTRVVYESTKNTDSFETFEEFEEHFRENFKIYLEKDY